MRAMKVLAISGSLRRDSRNTELARAAAELLPPSAELEVFDGLKAVEPYDEDDDVGGGPSGAGRLREAIESADAILIATPEYNSSLPDSSRTRSTGPRGRSARMPSGASPSRWSAPAPGCSVRSGHSRRSGKAFAASGARA